MTELRAVADSLVLYKTHPARVLTVGEKLEIELDGGQLKRVRAKDIQVLHPGPLRSLGELRPQAGDLLEAWELLAGGCASLRELAELIYMDYTPATAWATWQWVAEGLYFAGGGPEAIQVRSREEVERDRLARETRERERREWDEFLARLGQGQCLDTDRERLQEVERLALGQAERSRILHGLGYPETPQSAHRLLVGVGYWHPRHNPHPGRHQVALRAPDLPVPDLPGETRRDFTGLPAFAIDDEGNQDPDDALSLDGDRVWVHVADVAALVDPDGPLDREARARGANLYAPEGVVPMLPDPVTQRLGLGLSEVSPALSIGFCHGPEGLGDIEILPSWVRVRRISYQEVETRLEEAPFRDLLAITERFRAHRHARDAAAIELPEVSVRVLDGAVHIHPLVRLVSRALVTDAMLMAGEAVARFCAERGIPIPYATQDGPDQPLEPPRDLATMYAYRRRLKPTRLRLKPAPHAGLGLPLYVRATSPLRRYSDLLVHQQLRAHLRGAPPLEAEPLGERLELGETGSLAIRRAERQSNLHWKLVWLREHPDWKGQAVVVDQENKRCVALIPELALEARVRPQGEPRLNDVLELRPREIDLPELLCYFKARLLRAADAG